MKTVPVFKSPLAIHCVWNIADASVASSLVKHLERLFSRDILHPFSRRITLPLFCYESESPGAIPPPVRKISATQSICFFFTSENTAGRDNWIEYANVLSRTGKCTIVPIALNSGGFAQFDGINAIRYQDGDSESRLIRTEIKMVHEIFRYGFSKPSPKDIGIRSSLNIFLSHCKVDNGEGIALAEKIRQTISQTNMTSFFDVTTISPGKSFAEEIEKHLRRDNSAFLAINTDDYSSRFWCQREILAARKHNLPFLVVECLSKGQDRVFPALSNMSVINVSALTENKCLEVLLELLAETVRCKFMVKLLEEYKRVQWIPHCMPVLPRPPDVFSLKSVKHRLPNECCYPDPPLFKEELQWLIDLGCVAKTPLQLGAKGDNSNALLGKKVGLSISDVDSTTYSRNNSPYLLKAFSQDLARHIIGRSGVLVYCGDWRRDGFSEAVLAEAEALQNRIQYGYKPIENYLAWPCHASEASLLALKAKHGSLLDIHHVNPPQDVAGDVDMDIQYNDLNSATRNAYVVSRCLTEMRRLSVKSLFAKVCAGGKVFGYSGIMPGVLEEIYFALKKDIPVFLCGGFGGIVGEVCEAILTKRTPPTLTSEWQEFHNAGYRDLQETARRNGNEADYRGVVKQLTDSGVLERLSSRAGLTLVEYKLMMQSPLVDECIHLILKGLENICKNPASGFTSRNHAGRRSKIP